MRLKMLAAAGALAIASCTVPRPIPGAGTPVCNLQPTTLKIEVGHQGLVALNNAQANPIEVLLTGAGENRGGDVGVASLEPIAQLILSGGGQHGAFGSGFLAGQRPLANYAIITGVSTGALQAPFVMLGNEPPPADRHMDAAQDFPANANTPGRRGIDDLVSGYTITREPTLYRSRGELGVIRAARLGDLEPLRRRLNMMLTDQTLRRLATLDPLEKGLFVLLLNWDTGNAEQVDMLRLARRYADGEANARSCFVDVLIAASSEPLGAPPVLIDGRLYVDAGLRYGVFAPVAAQAARNAALTLRSQGNRTVGPIVRTDMIRNGDVTLPESRPERYSALNVIGRGRSILVNQVYLFSIKDVLRTADPDHQVRFAHIRDAEMGSGPAKGATFDPDYMKRILEVGRARGAANEWDEIAPK